MASKSANIDFELLTNVVSVATIRVISYLILLCCLMSGVSSLLEWMFSSPKRYSKNRCIHDVSESFSDLNREVRTELRKNIELTGVTSGSMLTGRAFKYNKDGKVYLEVESYLPTIDGDVLVPRDYKKEASSAYVAYLGGIPVGKLVKDGDGVYKLKVQLTDDKANRLDIHIVKEGLQTDSGVLLLSGSF